MEACHWQLHWQFTESMMSHDNACWPCRTRAAGPRVDQVDEHQMTMAGAGGGLGSGIQERLCAQKHRHLFFVVKRCQKVKNVKRSKTKRHLKMQRWCPLNLGDAAHTVARKRGLDAEFFYEGELVSVARGEQRTVGLITSIIGDFARKDGDVK